MCLGIPGKVVTTTIEDGDILWGLVEFAGVRRRVCLVCVPEVVCGEFVIVHAGLALSRIDAAEAEEVFQLIRALDQGEGWEDPA